jgi:hypothetical protein
VSVVGREPGAPGSNPITDTRRQVPKILEQDLMDKLLSDLRTELRSGVRRYINFDIIIIILIPVLTVYDRQILDGTLFVYHYEIYFILSQGFSMSIYDSLLSVICC